MEPISAGMFRPGAVFYVIGSVDKEAVIIAVEGNVIKVCGLVVF